MKKKGEVEFLFSKKKELDDDDDDGKSKERRLGSIAPCGRLLSPLTKAAS